MQLLVQIPPVLRSDVRPVKSADNLFHLNQKMTVPLQSIGEYPLKYLAVLFKILYIKTLYFSTVNYARLDFFIDFFHQIFFINSYNVYSVFSLLGLRPVSK